ncbi:leucine-rich repeat-containing protein 4C isoform X2 [Condylostylus longicornis]|uniref:leucine-rich repeat-containing protein 4C isoform X2 n=1 Tax=Condylostylus longicornis TaxID=2530218 RepID=UPI00244DFBD0|nr:leucine-rich repeat-containing protein 4C isoform X2 [Condylostylus longicornis]
MNPLIVLLYIGIAAIINATIAYGFIAATDAHKCKYLRVEKKLKVRCYRMDLKDVPQYLTSSIEILDLSYNRIKKLYKTSFERYTSVQSLLLYDNMIISIEPDTFSSLTFLEEIDLSNNGLTIIPLELFQLPMVRNVYLDSNPLRLDNMNELSTPIAAPLEYLNIADCELRDIPDLGILPHLWHLNASKNPLDLFSVTTLGTMCHLKSIDLYETNMPFCACHSSNQYLNFLGVKTNYNFNCDKNDNKNNIDPELCPNLTNYTIMSEEFKTCNSIQKAFLVITPKNIYWLIGAGIAAILILLTCLYCCIKSIRKKYKKPKPRQNLSRVGRYHNRTDDELLTRTKDDIN